MATDPHSELNAGERKKQFSFEWFVERWKHPKLIKWLWSWRGITGNAFGRKIQHHWRKRRIIFFVVNLILLFFH